VAGHLRGDVDVGQDVPVEHQEAVLEQVLGVLQGARGAARLGLLDEPQAHPEARAVAEHRLDLRGQEAARHDHVVHAVAGQPLEHEAHERPVDERHDRLRGARGERPQPRPLPADQDDGLHGG
jgi:hypothetical protein